MLETTEYLDKVIPQQELIHRRNTMVVELNANIAIYNVLEKAAYDINVEMAKTMLYNIMVAKNKEIVNINKALKNEVR